MPKRIFDIVVACAALVALSPLLAAAAVVVRVRMGRPVLFRQLRPGKDGRPFRLLKFRTMTDAVGPDGAALADAERLTATGRWMRRWSIDELPELLNVVAGDMSLVGPRPAGGTMSDAFLVAGAGGHARVVVDALLASGCRVLGCYDDDPSLVGSEPHPGVRVAGSIRGIGADWTRGRLVVVAIGDNGVRRRLSIGLRVDFGTVTAPSAVLGTGVAIGPGTMVLPSATVNVGSRIGGHVILNTSCSVDHDCRVGDYAHIAPGCRLGGHVTVGDGSLLGIGTCVIPGVRIGAWAVVGAGSVVTKDLPDNCTAVGVPARVIRTRKEGWYLG